MGLTWTGWNQIDEAQLIRMVEAGASFREMAAEIRRTVPACQIRVALLRKRGTLPPLRNNRTMAAQMRAAMRRATP